MPFTYLTTPYPSGIFFPSSQRLLKSKYIKYVLVFVFFSTLVLHIAEDLGVLPLENPRLLPFIT